MASNENKLEVSNENQIENGIIPLIIDTFNCFR